MGVRFSVIIVFVSIHMNGRRYRKVGLILIGEGGINVKKMAHWFIKKIDIMLDMGFT